MKSRRLRIIEALTRQTHLQLDRHKQQLRAAASARDESQRASVAAQEKLESAVAQLRQHATRGQELHVELYRNTTLHVEERLRHVGTAMAELKAAQATVDKKRAIVAKQRVRLEKLDDRHDDEVQQLSHTQQRRSQHEIDEVWLLKGSGNPSGSGSSGS